LFVLLRDGVDTYEAQAIADGIPEVVVLKFGVWHNTRVQQMMLFLDDVCHSDYYPSNTARMVAFLDMLQVAFHGTVLDAEHVLTELNGELSGCQYDGIVCP
jgi:hypothetical protein